MSHCAHGFQLSRYLQERICYLGQGETYQGASDHLDHLLGLKISSKQIERVCHCYGNALDDISPRVAELDSLSGTDEVVYGMVDGSMILTREEKWKEIKLGRIFSAESCINSPQKRSFIAGSIYTAHLGSHTDFLQKWVKEIPEVDQLVFVADGAKWFWNWASKQYPEAIQILDFYHCVEYLHEFVALQFKCPKKRKTWVAIQKERLLTDQVCKVIDELAQIPNQNILQTTAKKKIHTYFLNNCTRMKYGTYRQKGYLIGSGPIESAHRNVIQKRLKLAGQRWTKYGAQQIANLRVCQKSNRWQNVIELTKATTARLVA